MVRKLNKGVTIVEVLIALAIFLVMMIPLVSGLITGMKTSTEGKKLQYRNDYAQNLMENVKEISIDVLKNSDETYFENNFASENVTINKVGGGYQIVGTTYLGTDHSRYLYAVDVDDTVYEDVNKVTSGVVENLNKSKTALISAKFANYDTPATEALLTLKMAELRKKREKDGIAYNPITDVEIFKNDTGNRNICISIAGNASSGYDVGCKVYYSDNCSALSASGTTIGKAAGTVEYDIYSEHYNTMPNVYLMYNVCVYNGRYANEFITYDLSGLDDNTEANVFVFETASGYATDLKTTNTAKGADWLKGGKDEDGNSVDLYKHANSGGRDGLDIRMAVSTVGLTDAKKDNLHVYHNMIEPVSTDYATADEYNAALAEWNNHSKNTSLIFDSAAAGLVSGLFNTGATYGAMYDTAGKPMVKGLNKAQEENRKLYKVKIWMQEVPENGNLDAATLKAGDPILQGTRGGGEID